MGKKQHSKDKLYIIPSEYAKDWGGCSKSSASTTQFRILNLDSCSLSLQPFSDPVMNRNKGHVYDKSAILTFLKRFQVDPIDGITLKSVDLVPLNFAKQDGQIVCAISNKEMGKGSVVIANKITGNVYLKSTIDKLCKENKIWNDPVSGVSCKSSDYIIIQDISFPNWRLIDEFWYIKNSKVNKLITLEKYLDTYNTQVKPNVKMVPMIDKILSETKTAKDERLDKEKVTKEAAMKIVQDNIRKDSEMIPDYALEMQNQFHGYHSTGR